MWRWLMIVGVMVSVTACDELGMDGDGLGGPGMSGGTVGGTSTSGGTSGGAGTDGLGGTGNLPPTSTTGGTDGGTVGCGDETAADPWGDEDGCDGGLPTQSPWDVGNGGSCWAHTQHWNSSCEEEPCLDYDCHSPSTCGDVTFGDCGGGGGGGGTSDDGGAATTGGSDLEVDDPVALECILEALRDQVPIRFTVDDCDSPSTPTTTYEIVSNGLVITTTSEDYGDNHYREQRISTVNGAFDFDTCIGAGVSNYEKRFCVGLADGGPCPVGAVACPLE